MIDLELPPPFHGDPVKDDLPAYLHNLSAWYFSAKCTTNLSPAKLFQVISYRSFPYDSYACTWFKGEKQRILTTAASQTEDEDALFQLLLKALSDEFEHIAGDMEAQLYSMELKSGEDISAFAVKFEHVAKESDVKDDKAARKFILAVSKNEKEHSYS